MIDPHEVLMERITDAIKGAHGEDQQMIARASVNWINQILQKNSDYGGSVFEQPVLAPECSVGAAIRVRMSDKINRIRSLLSGKDPEVNESLEDTFADIGSYCLLELVRRQQLKEGST